MAGLVFHGHISCCRKHVATCFQQTLCGSFGNEDLLFFWRVYCAKQSCSRGYFVNIGIFGNTESLPLATQSLQTSLMTSPTDCGMLEGAYPSFNLPEIVLDGTRQFALGICAGLCGMYPAFEKIYVSQSRACSRRCRGTSCTKPGRCAVASPLHNARCT